MDSATFVLDKVIDFESGLCQFHENYRSFHLKIPIMRKHLGVNLRKYLLEVPKNTTHL